MPDYLAKWPELVTIDLSGSLKEKALHADFTVRSSEWSDYVRGACVGRTKKEKVYYFPKFVDRLLTCISLAGPGICPKPEHQHPEAADFPCP